MKKLLIISPHFPPVNAPDMQRVRMSLPYYRQLGWEPVVVCVDEKFVTGYKDELLSETISPDIEIHRVKAWPEKFTRKFGIGSLSLRSYYQFKKKGNALLSKGAFDLVLFSTTLFHVCALGRYWKKKFNVPFIVDMQDPWRNDFFVGKPANQQPPKYWITNSINKRLEAYTMPHAAGIMAVSQAYIDNLQSRYPQLKNKPVLLLPFGASNNDFQLVRQKKIDPEIVNFNGKINVVYAGGINKFFLPLIRAFFISFKQSVQNKTDYHFYFIGTNYAQADTNKQIEKIGAELGLQGLITEVTQRISYFSTLATLMRADILFIPGSSDADYNASKVYNNIFSGKPIFCIFNEKSLVKEAIIQTGTGIVISVLASDGQEVMIEKIQKGMPEFLQLHLREIVLSDQKLKKYMAASMTEEQTVFFNKVIVEQ